MGGLSCFLRAAVGDCFEVEPQVLEIAGFRGHSQGLSYGSAFESVLPTGAITVEIRASSREALAGGFDREGALGGAHETHEPLLAGGLAAANAGALRLTTGG